MQLYDEIYFEINMFGSRPELKKVINSLTSGALDDYLEFQREYVSYDDDFENPDDHSESYTITFSNDDYALEAEEFDVEDFLDTLCKLGRNVYLRGEISDPDSSCSFESKEGDSYFVFTDKFGKYSKSDLFEEDDTSDKEDEDSEEEES